MFVICFLILKNQIHSGVSINMSSLALAVPRVYRDSFTSMVLCHRAGHHICWRTIEFALTVNSSQTLHRGVRGHKKGSRA